MNRRSEFGPAWGQLALAVGMARIVRATMSADRSPAGVVGCSREQAV